MTFLLPASSTLPVLACSCDAHFKSARSRGTISNEYSINIGDCEDCDLCIVDLRFNHRGIGWLSHQDEPHPIIPWYHYILIPTVIPVAILDWLSNSIFPCRISLSTATAIRYLTGFIILSQLGVRKEIHTVSGGGLWIYGMAVLMIK